MTPDQINAVRVAQREIEWRKHALTLLDDVQGRRGERALQDAAKTWATIVGVIPRKLLIEMSVTLETLLRRDLVEMPLPGSEPRP